eukprot:COSAG01_NODE_8227_length_2865_cov_3.757050_4_plen_278_part_00
MSSETPEADSSSVPPCTSDPCTARSSALRSATPPTTEICTRQAAGRSLCNAAATALPSLPLSLTKTTTGRVSHHQLRQHRVVRPRWLPAARTAASTLCSDVSDAEHSPPPQTSPLRGCVGSLDRSDINVDPRHLHPSRLPRDIQSDAPIPTPGVHTYAQDKWHRHASHGVVQPSKHTTRATLLIVRDVAPHIEQAAGGVPSRAADGACSSRRRRSGAVCERRCVVTLVLARSNSGVSLRQPAGAAAAVRATVAAARAKTGTGLAGSARLLVEGPERR